MLVQKIPVDGFGLGVIEAFLGRELDRSSGERR
jgi:hypothetical protein